MCSDLVSNGKDSLDSLALGYFSLDVSWEVSLVHPSTH